MLTESMIQCGVGMMLTTELVLVVCLVCFPLGI